MKKTYIVPETETMIINVKASVLGSSPVPVNSTGDPVDAGNAASRDYFLDF